MSTLHELLISDSTFGERWKGPLNLVKSGDLVELLLTFQIGEVKQKYLKDSFQKVFLLKMSIK